MPAHSASVRALSRAVLFEGLRPVHNMKTGTSDMNTLGRTWNIRMATYGPGHAREDHTDTEHILVADYLAGIRVLRAALGELDKSLGGVSP